MHTLLLVLLAAIMNNPTAQPAAHTASPDSDPRLAPFRAVVGHWTTGPDEPPMHETWMPPHGNNMTGMLRWYKADGTVRMFELMTITAEPEAVRLRIRHFDGTMNPWASEADGPVVARLTDSKDDRYVFTVEPEGDLRTITYDLSDTSRMTAILGFAPGRDPIVIGFERAGED